MLCAALGAMTGVICLGGGLLRLGFVANFLSKPVIVGFMHGIALVIVAAQLPKVLGIRSAAAIADPENHHCTIGDFLLGVIG